MNGARRRWRLTGTAWRLAWIAAGLAAAAVNTGNNLLYLLLGLALGTVPLALVALWLNTSRLTVELAAPRSVAAGGAWAVELVLVRARRSSARGLELEIDGRPGPFGRAWVERIEGNGARTLSVPVAPSERGVATIRRITLRSSFPLGILTRTIEVPCAQEILILPRASAPGAEPPREIVERSESGERWRVTAAAGPAHEGVRRGGEHEDLRWVDWKATARRGALMLREPAGEGARHTRLNLTTELAERTANARERFEREVSRVAGIGRATLIEGGSVRLTVDGREAQSWSGPQALTSFLSRLARVEPTFARGAPFERPPASPVKRESTTVASAGGRTAAASCHRFSVLAALAVGIVTLFAYEGMGFVRFAALASALGAVVATRGRLVARPRGVFRKLWNVAAVVALALFMAELVWWSSPLEASISLVSFITLYLVFNASTARDDRLMLVVSLMQIVLGAALTTDVTFALPLAAWLVLALHAQAVWTSTPRAAPGAHRPLLLEPAGPPWVHARSALASTGALVLAGCTLFAVIPHLGTGAFDPRGVRAQRVSGFSETSRLGGIGAIKLDHRPVMEVALDRLPGEQVELLWRGIALEEFDGRTWRRSWSPAESLAADGSPLGAGDASGVIVQEFRLEPTDSLVIFAAERPVAIDSSDLAFLSRDESGTFEARARRRGGIDYVVRSAVIPREPERLRAASGEESAELLEKNLALPQLDPRITEAARGFLAASPTRYDAVLAIERWVAEGREYSIDVNDADVADPVAAFLFDGMAGHCEYFATGMVVLARAAGIPARFVKGYLRGDTNRFSRRYLVRQSDAHAWVEVHFPGVGWVPFDPTPPEGRATAASLGFGDFVADLHATVRRLWDDHLIGVDLNDQYDALLAARDRLLGVAESVRDARGRLLAAASSAAVAMLVLWVVRQRARQATSGGARTPAFYRKLLRWLARRGIDRRPGETPHELARRAAAGMSADTAARVGELTALYYRVRFARERDGRRELRRARELLGGLGR